MVVLANPPEHLLVAKLPDIEKLDLGVVVELGSELAALQIETISLASDGLVLEIIDASPAFKIVKIPCKGYGMIATRKLFPGDLILAEKPVFIVPVAIFNDAEQCEGFLDKEMNKLSSCERELVLSLSNRREVEEGSYDPNPYCGIFTTNAMKYEEDAVLCPVMARSNHSCKPNAEFITRTDLGITT